jgi:hypothetical protein
VCEILSEESGDTAAAAVKEIDEARQVPFQSALDLNPLRIPTETGLDPRVLRMLNGEN